jgi:hypothetical protein
LRIATGIRCDRVLQRLLGPGLSVLDHGRPAPAARTRPAGSIPARISFTAVCTVVRDDPDNRATSEIASGDGRRCVVVVLLAVRMTHSGQISLAVL